MSKTDDTDCSSLELKTEESESFSSSLSSSSFFDNDNADGGNTIEKNNQEQIKKSKERKGNDNNGDDKNFDIPLKFRKIVPKRRQEVDFRNNNNPKDTIPRMDNLQHNVVEDDKNDASNGNNNDNQKDINRPRNGKILNILLKILRNPILRIVVVACLLFLNVLIYNEDPISYSKVESNVYGLGRIYNYIFRQWPPNSEPLWIVIKVVSLLVWMIIGMLVGKYIIHDFLLRDALELKIFRKDMGSWTIMLASTAVSVFAGAFVYNRVISSMFKLSDGSDNTPYILTDYIGMTEVHFGIISCVITSVCGTFFLFVVIDSMMNDSLNDKKRARKYGCHYMCFQRLQLWWKEKRLMILTLYVIVFFFIFLFILVSNYQYEWIITRAGHYGWTQLERCLICGFIVFFDVSIVVQDWDFPRFNKVHTNTNIACCGGNRGGCKSRRYKTNIIFTGKWVNYTPLIITCVLNFSMLLNVITYQPIYYNQITDHDSYIRTINNRFTELDFNMVYNYLFNGNNDGIINKKDETMNELRNLDVLTHNNNFIYNESKPFLSTNDTKHFLFIGCNESWILGYPTEDSDDTKNHNLPNYANPYNIPWCIMCVKIVDQEGEMVSIQSNNSLYEINNKCFNVTYRFNIRYDNDIPYSSLLMSLIPVIMIFVVFFTAICVSVIRSKCHKSSNIVYNENGEAFTFAGDYSSKTNCSNVLDYCGFFKQWGNQINDISKNVRFKEDEPYETL